MDVRANPAIYEGGFSDPVFDAQGVFRAVMDALAHPGRIIDLGPVTRAPAPLDHGASAILAALADHDTPVWFEAEDCAEAGAWLVFHTGAPVADAPGNASFAVLSKAGPVESWDRFAIGTSSYPDRSVTLLLPVGDLESGVPLTLEGPGIETTATLAPTGLPDGFVEAMAGNAQRFPLGFDVILVAGRAIAALPRTTRITSTEI
ncbi:phosphonate C-P lyase system protein PhnH [Methylobrevis pamukkalensis]|uniref:Alpha-D-ribose 1-methylphosphonate 5-triphosphate synthase subunit PhnH n=1 Tax=Methylobrevis pamukkalensis TaxID=1439726 RepID=A0A1E3H2S2_9HYPH|nr:phosphonate C-P lyase system protein PhnH [Methylobrevis pamukkalensis]ODN70612.1 Alpha-D-ribose 1-methylphosphonate 5-triphosphate synthase subunit PhnH [Methylobrevis pamukkalensis]